MILTPETTIGELIHSGRYGNFASYFFTSMTAEHWFCPLKNYRQNFERLKEDLSLLEELAQEGKDRVYKIYSFEEQAVSWDKASVDLLHFPVESGDKPYVLIIPGGGLNRHWGLIEGLSIALACNQMGYSAFVLFYRTKQPAVLPLAVEDLYQAIRYIDQHSETFKVTTGHYVLGGFSAGGTIISQLLKQDLTAYHANKIAKPKLIFFAYAALSVQDFYQIYQQSQNKEDTARFLNFVAGSHITLENLKQFDSLSQLTLEAIPPLFITANMDDSVVPFQQSQALIDFCTKHQLPFQSKIGEIGGHSYGLGESLEVENWLTDCFHFLENL